MSSENTAATIYPIETYSIDEPFEWLPSPVLGIECGAPAASFFQ
jgi:hypothetical protein